MLAEFNAVPDILITHIASTHQFTFSYWQREGRVNRDNFSFYVQLASNFTPPSLEWISAMNLQLIAANIDMHLTLVFIDDGWWLNQPISADWQHSSESDMQRFMTQNAVAKWLETQASKQVLQAKQPGGKV